jgi:hypothetical protein
MSSRALCLAVAVALMAAAGAAEAAGSVYFTPEASGSTTFVMPSNNVECIFTPVGGSTVYMPTDGGPELSCDRAMPTYLRFTLNATGPAEVITDVGDQSCCGGPNTFAYGMSWRIEPFTCTSATTGLQCRRDDGHGFLISKAKVSAY